MTDMSQLSPSYNYSVKIMNPKKKSEFDIVQIKAKQRFACVDDLKQQLLTELRERISDPLEQVGYIEPGHGLRGKQRWLSSDDDLDQMYSVLKRKPYEVTLWCFAPLIVTGRGVKRSSANAEEGNDKPTKTPRKSYDKHVDKMAQVEEIEDKLREKYRDNYSPEQLRSWAHLYIMKKHDSLETPPDKPFWKGTSSKNKSAGGTASPSKRIALRGQCVDQLLKWHELLKKGAITKEQYDEFQSTIMEDVKKF